VVTRGTGPALAVRAFGSVERPAVRGVLLRVAPRALLLSRPSGRAVRIALGPATTVWRGGVRVRLRALRPGMRLDVYRGAGGAVRAIVIRSAAS
jgi:hypothetical protein